MKLLTALALVALTGFAQAQERPKLKRNCVVRQVVVSMPIGGNCAQLDNWLYVCYIEECR